MITVAVAGQADVPDWAEMRHALWPDGSMESLGAEITQMLARPSETSNLIARDAEGAPVGFAEASLRHDYVNGTETSPVVFLEGIYVVPDKRGTGIARQMVEAVEQWGRQLGCSELASDAAITNTTSHQMHLALGFEETDRVVYFRKALSR